MRLKQQDGRNVLRDDDGTWNSRRDASSRGGSAPVSLLVAGRFVILQSGNLDHRCDLDRR